jgi:hypothetical protein
MFKYRITVERVDDSSTVELSPDVLTFTASSHDDLFRVVSLTRAKGIVDENKSACLIVGLKLFAELMLEKREDTLFAPMMTPVRTFIQQLKALPDKVV